MCNHQKLWWREIVITWTVNSQIPSIQQTHSKKTRERIISKWAIRTTDQQLLLPKMALLESILIIKQEQTKSIHNCPSLPLRVMDRFQLQWQLIHASLILIWAATGSLQAMTITLGQSKIWWRRIGIPIFRTVKAFLRLGGVMSRRLTKPISNGSSPFNDEQSFLPIHILNSLIYDIE